MKFNNKDGKYNIITSEDIIMTGEQVGKKLSEIIDEHENKLNRLASNDKWLYKYGGFGSGTGGGGGSSDNWSIYAAINGQQVKSGNVITLYNSTTCRLEISINKPNAGIFNVTVNYEGNKSQRNTLDISNSYSWIVVLPITSNGVVSITVRDGNNMTNSVNCNCIVNPYDFKLNFTDSQGTIYNTQDNDIFIGTAASAGLKIAMTYDIAVDGTISYTTSNTFGIETSDEPQYITDKSGIIYFEVPNSLLNDDNAGYYNFNMSFVVALPNQKPVQFSKTINCNLIPNGLYLKVIPQNSLASIYTSSKIDLYNLYSAKIEEIEAIKEDINTHGSTPEKESNLARALEELEQIKNQLYTFNKGVVGLMVQIYDGQNMSRSDYYLTATNTNSAGTNDVSLSFTQFTERQYYSVNVIANDNSIGENIIQFSLKRGSAGTPKTFSYYYYINNEGSALAWYNNAPTADNHYRPQDVTSLFAKYANNNFIQMKSNATSSMVLFDTSTLSSTINILPNSVNDVLLSFGIQYSEINNINNPIITISAGQNLVSSELKIYQDKITLGSGTATSAEIYIPKESEYSVDDYSKYHLLNIYKRFVKKVNNDNYYEICIYIDGVFEQAFNGYVNTENAYTSIILNPSNFSLNMIEMTYFNNNIEVGSVTDNNMMGMDDAAISQYWYKYCELYRNRVGYNESFVELLGSMRQIHENSEGMMEVANSSVITDIATNVDIPVILFNHKLSIGEDFISWLTQSYGEAALSQAGQKDVTVQYSPGKSSLVEYNIPQEWGNSSFYIELQGSSTGRYKSKNVNLGIKSDSEIYTILYTPNFKNVTDDMTNEEKTAAYQTYLPENKFTLKADVVDSTHSNNTAIGAFVNANTKAFEKYGAADGNYSKYMKNCLLGFPVLVFLSLTAINGDTKYYYLGIYNFNLGRDSYFNMGYIKNSVLNRLERKGGVQGTLDDGFNICAVPTSEYALLNTLTIAEIQGGSPYYDFSQFDSTILFPITSQQHQNDSACMFGDFVPKTNTADKKILVEGVIKSFVEKVSRSGGYLFEGIGKHMDDAENNVSYGYTKSISDSDTTLSANQVPNYRTQFIRSIETGENTFKYNSDVVVPKGTINDLENLIITNQEVGTEASLDYESLVEYYTICMAFGLVDSVMKNLNIKCWNAKQTVVGGNTEFSGKMNIAFYDMDTSLGRTNNGEKVAYFAFSDYWNSTITIDSSGNHLPSPILIYRDFYPQRTTTNNVPVGYDIPSSYLFAIAKYTQIFIDSDNLGYITPENLWANWRRGSSTSASDISMLGTGELRNAKYFIDKYFVRNMDEIPEALFNANYRTKYLISESTGFNSENKLPFHGKGINEVRDWLAGRLHILDAYFNIANTHNIIQTLVYDENNNPTVWKNMQQISIVDGHETYTDINAPETNVNFIDTFNDDIYILQDIFGGSSPKTYSRSISTFVKALEYSPLIIKLPQQNIKYLFDNPNIEYLITYTPTGVQAVLFGGSKMWTYLSSINTLIDSNNNLAINSNYLENLTGTSGTCSKWSIIMPSLKNVSLTSPNYSGDLVFKIDESTSKDSYPNLTSINISGSQIKLNIRKEGVQQINASNVISDELTIVECNDLTRVNLDYAKLKRCTISPVWSTNISISNAEINELTLSGKPETLSSNKITINNNNTIEKLIVSNFSTIDINNCPNLKTIVLGDPQHIINLKLTGVYTNYEPDKGYLRLLEVDDDSIVSTNVLDLSKFINLKELTLQNTLGFTSINLQSGVKLLSSAFTGTRLTTINLYTSIDNGDGTYTIEEDAYDKVDNDTNPDVTSEYTTGLSNCSNGYIILGGPNIFLNTKYSMKSDTGGINRMVIPSDVTSISNMFKYSSYINGQTSTENGNIDIKMADAFLHSDYICKFENIENINNISGLFFGQSIQYTNITYQNDRKDMGGNINKNSRLSLGRFVNATDASEVYRRNKNVTILCRELFVWYNNYSGSDYTVLAQNKDVVSISNISINFYYMVENAFYDIIDKLQFFIANAANNSTLNPYIIIKKDLVDNSCQYYANETIKLWNLFHGVNKNGEEIYPSNIRGMYYMNFSDTYNGQKVTLDFNELFNSNWQNLETINNSFGGDIMRISNFTDVDIDMSSVDIDGKPVVGIGLRTLPKLRSIQRSFSFNNIDTPFDYYNFVNWGNIYSYSSTGLSADETCSFYKYITRQNLYNLADIMAGESEYNNTTKASVLNYVFKNLFILINNENDNELKLSESPSGKLSSVTQARYMFDGCRMITEYDFNNGNMSNTIPMHLSANTMADLTGVSDIAGMFTNIQIDSNLPVNFFNKRERNRTTVNVYCGATYDVENEKYDFTNVVPATLSYYKYTNSLTNISEVFYNVKIYGKTYFDDMVEWNNHNSLIAEDGNTYTEYWERLSGNPIQFSNGTLRGSYKEGWAMSDGSTGVLQFFNNKIKCGIGKDEIELSTELKQEMIENVCTHLLLPPDILWGCSSNCNCINAFADSYFEGIMPCQIMKSVQSSQSLTNVFYHLNVIPNYCTSVTTYGKTQGAGGLIDYVEKNNIYVYVPKGFISNLVLNNLFTFNLNAPSSPVTLLTAANGLETLSKEYDSYYVFRDDSIGNSLILLQNSLPTNQYQITYRIDNKAGIYHCPDVHILDTGIHYNIMINYYKTMQNISNATSESLMKDIIDDGIDCNKFVSFIPTGLVDSDTAALLHGHLFRNRTFDAYRYDITGENKIPVINVGNRNGLELNMNAILPSASSTISKNFINISGKYSNEYNSLWDTNIENLEYENYASLWNTSKSYYVNIFSKETGEILTIPINQRETT